MRLCCNEHLSNLGLAPRAILTSNQGENQLNPLKFALEKCIDWRFIQQTNPLCVHVRVCVCVCVCVCVYVFVCVQEEWGSEKFWSCLFQIACDSVHLLNKDVHDTSRMHILMGSRSFMPCTCGCRSLEPIYDPSKARLDQSTCHAIWLHSCNAITSR